MRRQLLESIADQGTLLALWWSDSKVFDALSLQNQFQALCGERPGLFVDLGGWLGEFPARLDCGVLFARRVQADRSAVVPLSGTLHVLPASPASYAEDARSIRCFLSNLRNIQVEFPFIALLLPARWQAFMGPAMASCRLVICNPDSAAAADQFAAQTEQLAKPAQFSLWWNAYQPDRKRFPLLARGQKIWKGIRPENSAPHELWRDLIRIRILAGNPPEGWLHSVARYGWLPVLLLCLLPFFPATHLPNAMSTLRNLSEDKSRFSQAAYIEMEFNGSEPVQRVARYAIGRFTARVTNESMIAMYVRETLTRNALSDSAWTKKEHLRYPPSGTRIRFYPPETIQNPRQEVDAPAWRYFASILNDSIAYITEMYNVQASDSMRKHDGVDIGGRMGARILAPFSGQAWTLRDERGGVIIGIVRGQDVMLFMHCDQLLYLDGQDVMEGDPIATIGMTGHTTGPHVHLATGLVSPNGQRRIGNVRYDLLNPFEWYRIQAKRLLR